MPSLHQLRDELDLYRDWLMHRIPAPAHSYHEVAVATFARGKEIEQLILRQEADGVLVKGSSLTRFRTGELRSFLEMASKCVDRGSREITLAQMELEHQKMGI